MYVRSVQESSFACSVDEALLIVCQMLPACTYSEYMYHMYYSTTEYINILSTCRSFVLSNLPLRFSLSLLIMILCANRIVFVLDENDTAEPDALRRWGELDSSSPQGTVVVYSVAAVCSVFALE